MPVASTHTQSRSASTHAVKSHPCWLGLVLGQIRCGDEPFAKKSFTARLSGCAVSVVGVGAVVGAVVGVLGADPVLVVPPHALTPITSTRPMTMSKARFGTTFMSVLLNKQCSSLVSPTPDVCDEVVLTPSVSVT